MALLVHDSGDRLECPGTGDRKRRPGRFTFSPAVCVIVDSVTRFQALPPPRAPLAKLHGQHQHGLRYGDPHTAGLVRRRSLLGLLYAVPTEHGLCHFAIHQPRRGCR